MSHKIIFPALLALGLTSLAAVPLTAHAQTAQVAQKPVLTTLHRFDLMHGISPQTTLTLGTDGKFYGVTETGGIKGRGTVFQMTPAGQVTTLWRFNGTNGEFPFGRLVEGADGAFYGTASGGGGSHKSGTVFRITKEGRLSTLHVFNSSDGAYLHAGLTPAPDGSFYGTTVFGGTDNAGTVFHVGADGMFKTLHNFSFNEGSRPFGTLVLGPDGALYGTAYSRGDTFIGTIYRITASGTFSVLHSFTENGDSPYAGLTVGPDGALYGVAENSGVPYSGTAFRITTAGKFTTLHKFSNDGHGSDPIAELTLGADGFFYGTTLFGGTNNGGTVFSLTPQGRVTTLYKFHTAFDGRFPAGGVVFGPNGLLYGTTREGGANGYGTTYKLTLPQ